MLATTEKLLDLGFRDRVFKKWSFDCIFEGAPAKQYALIHKALKKGELLRLHRGVYMLASKYRSKTVNLFSIANQILPSSFVSFESALAFHGWIPERVNLTMSVIFKGRTRSVHTALGDFDYIKIPVRPYEFLSAVSSKKHDGESFLIADPLRALADYVYLRKIEWNGLDFLLEGMRIDIENLMLLGPKDFDAVWGVYQSKRVLFFLENLRKALEKS